MSESADFWARISRPPVDRVVVGGSELRRGSRVLLRPAPGGDIMDLALSGRTARVESLEQDENGRVHVAVAIEDDPGKELGEARFPGHRFFFSIDEVEPIGSPAAGEPVPGRILVAGIGNIFLGDDGFGVAVVRRLAEHTLPAAVDVVDYGIRGLDLALALQNGYQTAILVDAAPRGGAPGTLYLLEPELEQGDVAVAVDTHGMDPFAVLKLVGAMGGVPPRTLVVGCEPHTLPANQDYEDVLVELSEPVRAAVDEAVKMIESLIEELRG